MFKKLVIPAFFSRNIYLLVIAAWLITLSFLIDNYWSSHSSLQSVQKKMTRYVQDSEEDFAEILKDSSLYFLNRRKPLALDTRQELASKDYYIFLYQAGTNATPVLKYWNTQNVVPDVGILTAPVNAGFTQLPNGFYVWNKFDKAGTLAVALIPVKWNYVVDNDYLVNNFVDNPSTGLQYDIFPGGALQGNVNSMHEVPLFYLVEKRTGVIRKDNVLSVWFRFVAALFIMLFIHLCAVYISISKRFLYGFLFLTGTVIFLRFLSYLIPIPLNMRQLELFDPTIYGSNFILRSLGDLLINAVLFVWIVMFSRQQLQEKRIAFKLQYPNQKWVLLAAGAFTMLGATFMAVHVIRSLVADSQISFDVINFFSLNVYSVIGFVILCCIAVGYYFLCQLVLYFTSPFFSRRFIELYLAVTILGLMLLSLGINMLNGDLQIFSVCWLLFFLFLINTSYLKLLTTRIVSSKLVFWIFFFSISMTVLIVVENTEKEIRSRKHYAEVLATKTNPASEAMLKSMLTDFRLDFLSNNFNRLKDRVENETLKDSLIKNNSIGYNNRYDTRIYAYDEKQHSLFNEDNSSYNQLNSILNTQSKGTSVPGLFYYDESYDRFNYISKKVVTDTSGLLLGTVMILVSPKKIQKDLPFPDMFSRGSSASIENSSVYAFAIYNDNKLINSHNDYPFATSINTPEFSGNEYKLVKKSNSKKSDSDELWYNVGGKKYIVIVKENRQLLESITLFSYFFCAFLLLTAALWLLTIFVTSRMNPQKLRNYWQLSIRNQIHGIIIFISALSFIVIGVATILFFISRYESNNQEKLSRAIQIMKNQVSGSLSEGWKLTDSMLVVDRNAGQFANKNIMNIAEIHGVDVNIYDLNGDLKVASLAYPYLNGIVSRKMEPSAYFHLNEQKEVQYFQKEHIGKLQYVSSYVPVFDNFGNTAAYLNIPYFTSEKKLEDEIANFLVTIINLNAFIFLMAGIVSLFITNRITESFSVISEKMKRINLGKINEAIQWNRNDEIGSLVKEYNKMLAKLDESAAALAKTEREGAWREMAKQVAHEIKNPLTPMKLSMQFLQRSIQNNSPDVKALTVSVANTMVEQIDHLSNIASEFSQFANIENANKETLDINEVLFSIKQLHEPNEQISMYWRLIDQPIHIHADKTHINRLFTNLIQNALQSVRQNIRPNIEVEETLGESEVIIKIKDNGEGIADSIQSEIFTPNFTTKTSGTGLGLAMCKRIVEQMNGRIWFETSTNGTIFFIQLPLSSG